MKHSDVLFVATLVKQGNGFVWLWSKYLTFAALSNCPKEPQRHAFIWGLHYYFLPSHASGEANNITLQALSTLCSISSISRHFHWDWLCADFVYKLACNHQVPRCCARFPDYLEVWLQWKAWKMNLWSCLYSEPEDLALLPSANFSLTGSGCLVPLTKILHITAQKLRPQFHSYGHSMGNRSAAKRAMGSKDVYHESNLSKICTHFWKFG